jgi:hypothetical protein
MSETLSLLSERSFDATICPSEVARRIAAHDETSPDRWRSAMPAVHAAVDRLRADGRIALSWKGRTLSLRGGPYRIRKTPPDSSG